MKTLSPLVSRQIESMRGLSALVVLLGHAHQTFVAPAQPWLSTYTGFFTQMAVMVFFVLSGFLIGKSVSRNREKNGTFNLKEYAVARLIRLYPPLLASLLLIGVLYFIAPLVFPSGSRELLPVEGMSFVRAAFDTTLSQTLGALLFLNGFRTQTPFANAPLWSLPYEFWYYVLAVAIYIWPAKKILAALILYVVYKVAVPNDQFIMLSLVWFSGLLLAELHDRELLSSRVLCLTLLVTTFVMVAAVRRSLTVPSQDVVWKDPTAQYWLVSGLWFASYLGLILKGVARFSTAFAWSAPFSYTLYVTHFPLMLFVLGATQNVVVASPWCAWLMALGVVVLVVLICSQLANLVENRIKIRAALARFGYTNAK